MGRARGLKGGKPGEGEPGTMLFAELVEKYHGCEAGRLSSRTQQEKKPQLQFWLEQFGAVQLDQVTPKLVSAGVAVLAGRGWKAGTVNAYLGALSRVFRFACQVLACIDRNPCQSVKPLRVPARDRVQPRWLSRGEMEALGQACRESSCTALWPVLVVMLLTGARIGEVKGLKWSAVDLEAGHVLFLERGRRRVPLRGAALDVMRLRYENRRQGASYCFASPTENRPLDFRHSWEKAVDQAGLSGVKPSDVQATVIDGLYRDGLSAEDLAQLVGVKSVAAIVRLLSPAGRRGRVDAALEKMSAELFPG